MASKGIRYWVGLQVAKFAKRALKITGVSLRDPALYSLFGMKDQDGAIHVDEVTAHNFAAYNSGVQLISSTLGSMPITLVRIDSDGGETPEPQHIFNALLGENGRPNPNMSSAVFVEYVSEQAVTWGNGYAKIERTNGAVGPPIALWPIPSKQMTPYLDPNGKLRYEFKKMYEGEKDADYSADEILHIPGPGFNGVCSRSVISIAADSIGLGLAAQQFGTNLFTNNAIPGGIITHPGDLGEAGKGRIRQEFEERLKGARKSRRIAVLDEGMKYTQISIPPEDAQFLQTRQFQVREIARWLRVPPHMIYDDFGSYNSNEQQGLEFLTYTLRPWITRWVGELHYKLLSPSERKEMGVQFDHAALITMDGKALMEFIASARNNSMMSVNEGRKRLRLPLADKTYGSQLLAPSTMRTLGAADPSTPIDPKTLADTIAIIKSLKTPSAEVAKSILNTTMPSATDAFVSCIITQLISENAINALKA